MLNAIILFATKAAEKGAAAEAAPGWIQFAPLLVIAVLFYLLFIVPQRRERRQREDLFGKLKKSDRVITNAGIFGVVTNIKDEEVTLRIDDTSNARLTVLKSSIARIMTAEDQAKEAAARAASAAAEGVKAGAPPAKS